MITSCFTSSPPDFINVMTGTRSDIQETMYHVYAPWADTNTRYAEPGEPKKIPMHKAVPLAMRGRLLMRRKVKLYPRWRLPSRRNRNLQQQ